MRSLTVGLLAAFMAASCGGGGGGDTGAGGEAAGTSGGGAVGTGGAGGGGAGAGGGAGTSGGAGTGGSAVGGPGGGAGTGGATGGGGAAGRGGTGGAGTGGAGTGGAGTSGRGGTGGGAGTGGVPSLYQKYATYFPIGAAVDSGSYTTHAPVLKTHFNSVTAENEMKWDALEPTENSFNYAAADAIVNFAMANNMKVRGHTLVWHSQNPSWAPRARTQRAAWSAAPGRTCARPPAGASPTTTSCSAGPRRGVV